MLVTRSHLHSDGGALRLVDIEMQLAGDVSGQYGNASLLVAQGAELLLEGHAVELAGAAGQRLPAILRPEERGILQARPDDTLVAGPDLLRFLAGDIGDGDETGQQGVVRAVDRKKLLVILHAGHQGLVRDLEEARVECTADGDRPLHQCRHLVQQVRVDAGHAVQCRAGLRDLRENAVAAPVHVGHDPAGVLQ